MENAFSHLGYILFFLKQQEIKRALHQSTLGLFIIVWEEVSAIFIDYLSNSPSIHFLKKIAVYDSKEYQSDVGNLLHIHLLGKIHHFSEQSRAELFDFIRKNTIDII